MGNIKNPVQDAEANSADTILEKELGNIVVRLKLSPDRLALYMDCERTNPKERCTFDRGTLLFLVKSVIEAEHLNSSVLDDIIRLVKRGEAVQNRRVAQGKAPRPAKPTAVEFITKESTGLNDIQSLPRSDRMYGVAPGMVMALVAPPQGGTPGRDVFGQSLTGAAAMQFDFVCGRGLGISGNKFTFNRELLIAEIGGRMVRNGGRLEIDECLELPAAAFSDLKGRCFVGRLKIAGAVLSDACAIAAREVQVEGDVLRAEVQSKLGTVCVQGDVNEKSRLKSSHTITVRTLHASTAHALGAITALGEIRQSNIFCCDAIVAPSGGIWGCEVSSVAGLEAQEIGSDGSSPMKITCCGKFILEDQLDAAVERERELQAQLSQVGAAIKKLLSGTMTAAMELGVAKELNQLIMSRSVIHIELEAVKRESALLSELISSENRFKVNFLKQIKRGVSISVGRENFVLDADIQGPGTIEYRQEHQRFVVLPYSPLEKRAEDMIDRNVPPSEN